MTLGSSGPRLQRTPFAAISLLIAGACSTAAQAGAVLTRHVPDAVAYGQAQKLAAVPADSKLDLAISLPLRNQDQLQAFLKSLYDPASLEYRQYLSVAEFTAEYGPSQADYGALQSFAAAHHLTVTATSANRQVLDVAGRAADIEEAFQLQLNNYRDAASGRSFYAPDREPSSDLPVAINHITGLDNFSKPVAHYRIDATADKKYGTGSGPRGSFLGSDVRAAYYGGSALTGAGQQVGLLELGSYAVSDVQMYFQQVGQPLNVPVVGVSTDGTSVSCSSTCNDGEQVLDIEEAISMAPGLSQLTVYVGKHAVSVLNRMASDNSAKQLSSSWGWDLTSTKVDDPIFQEFAAQGQSFVDATGDYGYQLKKGGVWPADDQYVTAVGGTDLVTNGAGGSWQSETGWVDSGGGPSPDAIPIPYYQVPFINASNQGAVTLRNVPDIAGLADTVFYICSEGSCQTGWGGTSFAAPLWAGFIALANEQATAEGKPTLGFLNPAIYAIGGSTQYAADFHDITSGYNGMFTAVGGFDLVTGFGSPQGQALIDALIQGN